MPKTKREWYVERVWSALTMHAVMELEPDDFVLALEEISADVAGMLQAAREDARDKGVKR